MEYHISYLIIDIFFLLFAFWIAFLFGKFTLWLVGHFVYIDDNKRLEYLVIGIYTVIINLLFLGIFISRL